MRFIYVKEEISDAEINAQMQASSTELDNNLESVGELSNTLSAVDNINGSINENNPDVGTLVNTAESLLNYIKIDVLLPGKKSLSTEQYRKRSIRYTKESLGDAIARGFKTIIDVIKKIIESISKFFKSVWYFLTGEKSDSSDLDKDEKKSDDEKKKIDDEAKEAKERIKAAKTNTPVNVPSPPPDDTNPNNVTPGNGPQPTTPPATKTPDEIKAEEIDKAKKQLDDAITNYKNGYIDRLKNHNIALLDDNAKYVEMNPDTIVAVFPKVIGICNNLKSLTEKVNSEAMAGVHTWLNELDNDKIESPNFNDTLKKFTHGLVTTMVSTSLLYKASDGKYKNIIRKGYSDRFLLIEVGVEADIKFTQEVFTVHQLKDSPLPSDLEKNIPEPTKVHSHTSIKPGYDKTIGIFRGLEVSQNKIKKEWEKFINTMEGMSTTFTKKDLTPENQSKARQAILVIVNNYKIITEMIKAITQFMIRDFDQLKEFYKDIICTRNNSVIYLRSKLETIQNS